MVWTSPPRSQRSYPGWVCWAADVSLWVGSNDQGETHMLKFQSCLENSLEKISAGAMWVKGKLLLMGVGCPLREAASLGLRSESPSLIHRHLRVLIPVLVLPHLPTVCGTKQLDFLNTNSFIAHHYPGKTHKTPQTIGSADTCCPA